MAAKVPARVVQVKIPKASNDGLDTSPSAVEQLPLLDEPEAGLRLSFVGKDNARQLARKVRPRVMAALPRYSFGSNEDQAKNLVIEGDNLQSMVTLYRERGQVDLILADPPYNTGNDFRYNDKWEEDPNDPGLGEFVSPDDGARHTKWMRFMWPRLQMMKSMLKPGGVLAICIDHRELFHLGQMCDELFRGTNRLAIINWQKATALKNDNNHISSATEYVLVYARDISKAKTLLLERTESDNRRYSNPDGDEKDDWREGRIEARTWSRKDDYAIQSPFTGVVHYPAGGGAWRHPKRHIKVWLQQWGVDYEERDLDDGKAPGLMIKGALPNALDPKARKKALARLDAGNWPFIWFGRDGGGIPRKKIYLSEIKGGKIPMTYWANENYSLPLALDSTSWNYEESGRSSDGASELTAIVGADHGFVTVKPMKLFEKIIQLWCPPDGLVLDPFAGSGTTGHAVVELNTLTDASRRFTLIEQGRPEKGDSYARSLLAERLKRAISGDWVKQKADPLPSGFRFVALRNKVDASAVLLMEREEMVDTVIASYFDATKRRGSTLIRVEPNGHRYLVAKNGDGEGFFLVWDGPKNNTDFTEEVYEAVAKEAKYAKLKPIYHIYARFNLYQTENVRFYQIPDRILADFGLDIRSEPFHDADDS